MSENILSLEDLKVLEQLYTKHDMQTLRFDEDGISMNSKIFSSEDSGCMSYLSEMSKKLKFRLNSNCQLNFSSGFNFDVVRI